jgi:hypothetical protein
MRSPRWSLLLVAAAVLSVVSTEAWGQRDPRARVGVRCVPCCDAEFVNDVKLWNRGTKLVPKGSRISWDVGNGKWTGHVDLTSDFLPGAEMILRNVMNGAQIQSPCTTRVVEPYPQYTVSLSPANLTVNFGQEGTLTATLDKTALTVGIGSQVTQSGPTGVITLNGEQQPVVMFGGGKLTAPITVKGTKAGGPVTVTIQLAPSVGGATASATVRVKMPLQRQRKGS